MIKYSFSKREIALIVAFAVILIGLLWYQFVFVSVNDQLNHLDAEIAETQQQTELATAQLAQKRQMETDIKDFKKSGAKKVTVPAFDNTTKLMARLNSVLSSTHDYRIAFDEIDAGGSLVKRGADITFNCKSISDARSVMKRLEQDTYACSIDSVNMNTRDSSDNTASEAASANSTNVSLHAVFYETNG